MHREFTHKRPNPTLGVFNIGLVAKAVIELQIARRTLSIYPITHEQVKRSIVKAFKSLGQIFGSEENITLIVLKEGIGVDDRILDAKSPVLADFAGVLKNYQIATVTIKKNININELARFLQLICMDRTKIMAKGGISAVARRLKFPNIGIQAVDYSQLQLTEEDAIHRSTEKTMEKATIWQQFVSRLTVSQTETDDGVSPHINPVSLAQMLNQKGVDVAEALNCYQAAIAIASKDGDRSESSVQEMLAFKEMILELDKGLRDQFLSATFDHCTRKDTLQFIDGLGGDLIVQMLHHASSEGKKISPSLLAFVQKMGHADALPEMKQDGNSADANAQGFTSETVASLLDHEAFDEYVDSDYEKMLGRLTGESQKIDHQDTRQSLYKEVIGELTGGRIHAHTGRAITRLMIHSTEIADYRDWARQLTFLLDDLVDHGAYAYLTQVLVLIRREKKNKDPERAEIAGLVLDRFSDPQFVARAIESVQSTKNEADPKALAFFMELGEPVVVEIFDGLDPNQTFNEQNVLTQILKNLKSLTAQEALERIKDPRPDYVRRMVRIICKMGDSHSVEQIRPLMDHADIDVRMEVLATLLAFNNNWGVVRLRDLLGDPMGDSFIKAADLAGRYRVRSVIPQLEAVAMQRGETAPRESAIRALGQIGDPKVIPTLTKITRTRWSMAKAQTRYLKQVVFDTLGNYPSEAVHNLLLFGLKQKDAVIRTACQRLLSRGGKERIKKKPGRD